MKALFKLFEPLFCHMASKHQHKMNSEHAQKFCSPKDVEWVNGVFKPKSYNF